MQKQWARLSLFAAIAISLLMILFPPFIINGGPIEYGFLLSGPPSVHQATAQMSALGGSAGAAMAKSLIHFTLDVTRLVIQLALVWIVWIGLRKTVLKPALA